MTVTTVYATAPGGNGYIISVNADYATARVGPASGGGDGHRIGQNTGYFIYEAFVIFDTSGIDDAQVVSAVALRLAGSVDSSTVDFTIGVAASAYDGGVVVTGDWVSGASIPTPELATWNSSGYSSGYNSFTETANFKDAINLTGNTSLILYSQKHRDNTAPTTSERVTFVDADAAGTTTDPKLDITHATVTTVTPGAASLTLTAYSPSAKVNNIATPGALSLTTTRYTPSAILNNIATPGALSAALTAYAPAATVGLAVTPGTLATALTAYTPTLLVSQSATPGTLALALTAYEPGAIVNHIATPGAGSMALTAYAPTVLTPVVVTPGAGSLALTAYAPSVVLNFVVTPGAGSLAIATYGINIYLPGSAFGARQYWRSTQHREYTKLVPYRDYRRSTTYKDYIKHVKWVDRA